MVIGVLDALFVDVLLAGDACGVDAKEDVGAVSGPFGYLGGWYAGVEPVGEAGVAEV